MDFITHTLMGVGAGRAIAPRREWRPQLALAAVLGSTLMDADSLVAVNGLNEYGLWHRVVTHSFVGLAMIVAIAAALAWTTTRYRPWRRFGWFVEARLTPESTTPTHAPLRLLLAVAGAAAALHWCGDVITGFGNMTPFWPWSRWDASLHAVFSFDWVIFGATLAWFIAIRRLDWPRRRELWLTAAYAALVIAYVAARLAWGQPTFV